MADQIQMQPDLVRGMMQINRADIDQQRQDAASFYGLLETALGGATMKGTSLLAVTKGARALDATGGAARGLDAAGDAGRVTGARIPSPASSYDNIVAWAEDVYEHIRKMDDDVPTISQYMRVPKDVVKRIRQHLFFDVHEVPKLVRPGEVQRVTQRFDADEEIAQYWSEVATGKELSAKEFEDFRYILAHEFVEQSLMQRGWAYRSDDLAAWGTEGNYATSVAFGAHDVAPATGALDRPWGHWSTMLGWEVTPSPALIDEILQGNWEGILPYIDANRRRT